MTDLLERTKPHTFKEFTIFKGVMEWSLDGLKQRYCVLDEIHWKSFYTSMQGLLGDSTNAILKKVGEDFGAEIFSFVREKYGADTKTAFLLSLQKLEKLGWGAFWNTKIDEEAKKIVLELHNSNEALKEGLASCYHVTGILRGLAKGVLGEERLTVREIRCTAKGDKICEFVIETDQDVQALYDEEIMKKLGEILQELKRTIKSVLELIATSDGVPVISLGLPEEIDPSLWGTITSFVLAGGSSGSEVVNNGNLKEVIINAEKGTIIATQCSEKTILVAVVGPDTSAGLAGLAIKKAKDKIVALLK